MSRTLLLGALAVGAFTATFGLVKLLRHGGEDSSWLLRLVSLFEKGSS